MLYKLYIGQNNRSKKLEVKKAITTITKDFQGFTITKGVGYWQGKAEKTLIIEIETAESKKLFRVVKNLAKVLKQQAIGIAKIGKMQFVG